MNSDDPAEIDSLREQEQTVTKLFSAIFTSFFGYPSFPALAGETSAMEVDVGQRHVDHKAGFVFG